MTPPPPKKSEVSWPNNVFGGQKSFLKPLVKYSQIKFQKIISFNTTATLTFQYKHLHVSLLKKSGSQSVCQYVECGGMMIVIPQSTLIMLSGKLWRHSAIKIEIMKLVVSDEEQGQHYWVKTEEGAYQCHHILTN